MLRLPFRCPPLGTRRTTSCVLSLLFIGIVLTQGYPALAQTGSGTPAGNEQAGTQGNRGWEGLAKALDAITPSVDTSDTRSGTEITDEIETLINRGQARTALTRIESREAELAAASSPGTDVQLMFQKARALAELGQIDQAQSVYKDMTIRFPELAEPWNNLAVLYIQQGSLQQAELALQTAIMNNPAYTSAIANLADLRLLMALRDYQKAASMKSPGAAQRAKALESFLKSSNIP